MKNLIKLIKSDNYLLLLSLGIILSFTGIFVMLLKMFPEIMMTIILILGIAGIVGGIVLILIFWWLSQIEKKG